MSPIDRCAVAFATHGCDFADALERNYQQGFVFATPDFFIMGRELDGGWFIEGMAGDMSKAWSILPYELPSVTFQRFDNELRSLPLAVVKRLTYHETSTAA